MSIEHYENFPVASLLVPAVLRPAVEAVYVWARTADDLADEGEAAPDERLAALERMEEDLKLLAAGDVPVQPVAQRLGVFVKKHALPLPLFHDLLSAFKQDVVTTRYADFASVRDYCQRSADPVGRLMLHLYQKVTPDGLAYSDAICTGLQLTNFWQDVAVDWKKNRVYLPQDSLKTFGVSESDIADARVTEAWKALLQHEIQRTRALLTYGVPLTRLISGRLGWELRLVIQGGLRILERIDHAGYDIFRARPKLGKTDWVVMAWRALTMTS